MTDTKPLGIALLGCTGSIGTSTLEVLANLGPAYRVVTLAAGHDRIGVIDGLLVAGTPVDAVDAWGSTALQAATENSRSASIAALVAAGAASS